MTASESSRKAPTAPPAMLAGYRLGLATEVAPGFLTVCEARVAATGERVTIRSFPAPPEARLWRAIEERVRSSHPGLVPARAAIKHEGQIYLVTDFRVAPTLANRVERGPVTPDSAVRMLAQVAEVVDGVEAAAHGILSPEGITLAGVFPPRVIVADLGLARSLRHLAQPWAHPDAPYFPPEAGRGEHCGVRSSVYSLGCILFECLSGAPPYAGSPRQLEEAHRAAPIPALSDHQPEVDGALDAVIARALAKDPDDRFGSAGELMDAVSLSVTGMAAAGGRSLRWEEGRDRRAPGESPASVNRQTRATEPRAVALERQAAAPRRTRPTARRRGPTQSRAPIAAAVLATLVVLAAAGVAGYLLGEKGAPAAPPPKPLTAGAVSLELPGNWQRRGSNSVLPGAALDQIVAAGPRDMPEAALVAGRTDASGDDYLPAALGTPRGRAGEPVRLGRVDALHRRDLRVAGSSHELVAYSIPTASGAIVLVCHSPASASRSFMPSCERVASTVDLRAIRAIPLAAVSKQRRAVAVVLAHLRRDRSAARTRLALARTPAGQARAARQLEASHGLASSALARLRSQQQVPGAQTRLRTALSRLEDAYGRLGEAAARRSSSRYAKARAAVTRADSELSRLLAGRDTEP